MAYSLNYTEINGGYEVTGIEGTPDQISIPEMYDDLPVISIGYAAFKDCTSLTNVIIPDSVISIGSSAFYNCSSLTSVIIPDSVIMIGTYAFCSCDILTRVVIGNSVTSIGNYAFRYCYGLTSVAIPDSVMSIGNYAFDHCSSLTEISFPDSITTIGIYACSNCTNLVSVCLPQGLTQIQDSTFRTCSSLTEIVIGKHVTNIANNVFNGDTKLTKVYYGGADADEWSQIDIGTNNSRVQNATRYYYRETQPSDAEQGNFWGWDGEEALQGFKISCDDANMINSQYFTVTQDGVITATSGTIGGFHITESHLASGEPDVNGSLAGHDVYFAPGEEANDFVFWAGPRATNSNDDSTRPFWVKRDGTMQAGKGTFIATMLEIKPSNQQYNAYIKFDANVQDAKLYINDTTNSITLSPTKLEFHGENVKDGSDHEFKGFISINKNDGFMIGTAYNDGNLYGSYPIGKLQGNWEVHRACTTTNRGAITNIRSITIPLLALEGTSSYWVSKAAVGNDNYCQLVTKSTAQTSGSIITALIYLFPKNEITMVGYLSGTSLYMEPLTATDSTDQNKYVQGNRFSYIDGGSCTPIAGVDDLFSNLSATRTVNNNFAILEKEADIQNFLNSITSRLTRVWVKYPPGGVVKAGGAGEETISELFNTYFAIDKYHLPIAIWTCGTFTSSGGNLYFLEKGNLINLFGSN